jgi:hypothetical protein
MALHSNEQFGKLTIIGEHHRDKKHVFYNCLCECGKTTIGREDCLKNGIKRSCGCIARERMVKLNFKHGLSAKNKRLYNIWKKMLGRCYNRRDSSYPGYGGRLNMPITVCEAWHDITNFFEWALSNGYQDTLSIDRMNNNGNYCPENCRWVDCTVQANNRRTNHSITINGETLTIAGWEKKFGYKAHFIQNRIKSGWSEYDAVMIPSKRGKKTGNVAV